VLVGARQTHRSIYRVRLLRRIENLTGGFALDSVCICICMCTGGRVVHASAPLNGIADVARLPGRSWLGQVLEPTTRWQEQVLPRRPDCGKEIARDCKCARAERGFVLSTSKKKATLNKIRPPDVRNDVLRIVWQSYISFAFAHAKPRFNYHE